MIFSIIIIVLFGVAIGSFINVVADRYNTGLAWWKGKSFCFSCNTRLKFNDLFPILSFLFLKGKCRYCGSKIPISAFVVELIMGILSLLAAFKVGFFDFSISVIHNSYFIIHILPNYLLLTSIFALILLISVYDLRHFIIPDSFLLILFVLALLYNSLFIIHYSIFYLSILPSFLSAIMLALPFLILFLISRGRWLGLGDVKYIAVLGALLGLVAGVSAVILAFWIGAAYALLALFVFKKNLTMKSEVPFGPFLSLGAILGFCFNIDLFHLHDLFQIF